MSHIDALSDGIFGALIIQGFNPIDFDNKSLLSIIHSELLLSSFVPIGIVRKTRSRFSHAQIKLPTSPFRQSSARLRRLGSVYCTQLLTFLWRLARMQRGTPWSQLVSRVARNIVDPLFALVCDKWRRGKERGKLFVRDVNIP